MIDLFNSIAELLSRAVNKLLGRRPPLRLVPPPIDKKALDQATKKR